MLLWVYVILMTVAAIAAVLWPLLRRRAIASSGTDIAVYRDQLQEIDRDLRLGLIPPAEAEAARVEVSRRLLAASQHEDRASKIPGLALHRNLIAGFAVLLLTVGAGSFYLRIGSPSMASESASLAASPAANSVDRLVAQAEEYLTRNPRDARGWEVLAPVYMRLGRYSDSANAWRNVVQLAGENADRLANLGEALTADANGIVTAEAKDAFTRSVALDSTTVTARFYIALAAEQDGKASEAAKMFKDLIADAPAGAPWIADVNTALARVEGKPDGAPLPPLSRITATQAATPQDPTVLSMVDRLAERLKQDGSDPDGWVRLVRSYKVLNDPAKKEVAIEDARKALAGDGEKLAKFEAGLKGVEAGEPVPAEANSQASASPANDETIRRMVEGLAERLKQDGSDPDAWVRLVRSYEVLKDQDKKQAAITDARKALAGDAEKLAKFEAGLKAVEAGEQPPPEAVPHAARSVASQDAGVQGMVDRLAERLKKDGSDPDAWLRLVRSYHVLKDEQKKAAAIEDAKKALAGDTEKLARLDSGLKAIEAGEEPPPLTSASAVPAGKDPGQHEAEAMVERLAQRLQKSGSDPEGWLMLTRSYATLQQPEKAKAAIQSARAALAGEPDKLEWFNESIKRFKLE